MPQTTHDLANCIRFLAADAIEKAKSGHPGLPLGMADVATVLFRDFLKFHPQDPFWPDRDRFVLSAGHGSMLLYALLYLTGYQKMTLDQLKNFRQLDSLTPGHPEYDLEAGIETTTGPLGQGIANAVGMALAERTLKNQYPGIVDHFTYVLAGDGCLMEGIAAEAISFAGHQQLGKLILLFDNNGITIDGKTNLTISINHRQFFDSMGWHVLDVDGHNETAIQAAFKQAHQETQKPTALLFKTVIGYGCPTKAGTEHVHGSPLGREELLGLRQYFDWRQEPFDIPETHLEAWRAVSDRSVPAYQNWQDVFSLLPKEEQTAFLESINVDVTLQTTIPAFQNTHSAVLEKTPLATRQCSDIVLQDLLRLVPQLVGGSADLSGSNNTYSRGMKPIQAATPNGNYIHYGIREHAMAGIMNGLALHGGFIPYGGTFLVFSDYCRPAIRLSALMQKRVIYVLTHDSVGLGEDGPTHQPIEQLMSLRLIPNLLVFRPADLVETLECWQCALQEATRPSVLVLSRQKLPQINPWRLDNKSQKGGYLVHENESSRDFTLIATGSELELAEKVYAHLTAEGYGAGLVSMPCTAYFQNQSETDKKAIIGDDSVLKVVIEAGVSQGWHSILDQPDVLVFGIDHFGVSAPGSDAFDHFGFSVEALVKKIKHHLITFKKEKL